MTVLRKFIAETVKPGKRLGRHVAHDPKSWRYPAPMSDKIRSVLHASASVLPLDQGNVGSCTGNAMVGMLMTEPFVANTLLAHNGVDLSEADALNFYSVATRIDRYRGVYPPEDTGSNGLAVCKAAVKAGYLKGYAWNFALESALRTITLRPVIGGFNWYSGMDEPDRDGIVRASGSIRGGHEFLIIGLHIENEHRGDKNTLMADMSNLVVCLNSWGPEWGHRGVFYIPIPDFGSLLKQDGDIKTGII